MRATIQKVKLERIDKIFKKHKPQGLGFSDNDAIILALKTEDGKEFTQTFYCRLKGDGTLGHSITRVSERRQKEVQNLIKKYISKDEKYISKDENYNIRTNIGTWKGKKVDVEEINGGYIIKI